MIYSFYFYLGSCLHYYKEYQRGLGEDSKNQTNLLIFALIGAVLTTIHVVGGFDNAWILNLVFFLAAVIDVVVLWEVILRCKTLKLSKATLNIDNHGMGIYLFQTEIMALVAKVLTGVGNYFAVWIITFFVGLVGAYALTSLIRKSHLTALIGEYKLKRI